ncbi:gamma-glutamyltransferase [Cohnella sp. GCM10027633]|uniref:gamma-glutamyltransferase n=1 Tax=unclassified Cohnella TaxID=2636738 RepID=UPI00363ADF6C
MGSGMTIGSRAMVASPHAGASEAGAEVLRRGGNAFDAAVAVSAALGVAYPHMTGLGGDAFFMLYEAGSGELVGYNGSGRAAADATIGAYANRGLEAIPKRGPLSAITVPGMVDAWEQVWARYGRCSWEQVLEAAVGYAELGCPVSPNLREWIVRDESDIRANAAMADVFLPGGTIPAIGDMIVQPDLANALKAIRAGRSEAFYRGELARSIAKDVREAGGFLGEGDFAAHRGAWVKPIHTDYRGTRIYQMPPNSQGFTVLMMLNILERFDLTSIKRGSADFYHLMAEAVKLSFRDRDLYLTDPEFADIPLDDLLSKAYAKRLAASIDPNAASGSLSAPMGQDTAYAAVVDEEGNAVSFIQSLYFDFGSCYMPGGTGVILQNRGSYFSLDPAHVNALEPGKRTFHTLMPAMAFKNGLPCLLFGTQGGEGQPQTQLSIATGVLDYGFTVEEAIGQPRWVFGRTWGQDSDSLKIEGRIAEEDVKALERKGHRVEVVREWDGLMGQAQAIWIDRENGRLHGAADPRGDGMAIGW